MKIKKIYYTSSFQKSWQKLSSKVKKKAIKKEKLFRDDAFYTSLLTHKLIGEFKNYWSFSIDYHYRVLFRFLKKGDVLFIDIGTHEICR